MFQYKFVFIDETGIQVKYIVRSLEIIITVQCCHHRHRHHHRQCHSHRGYYRHSHRNITPTTIHLALAFLPGSYYILANVQMLRYLLVKLIITIRYYIFTILRHNAETLLEMGWIYFSGCSTGINEN